MELGIPSVGILEFVARNNEPIRYSVSQNDYATLLRAVEYEGPPHEGVAWTLVQRFAYVYPAYKSLAELVSAYCQPINPKWFPDGSALQAHVRSLRAAGKHAEADREVQRAAKRPKQASVPLSQIRPATLAVVNSVLKGTKPSPVPGSVHFRAPTVQTSNTAEAVAARGVFAAKRKLLDTINFGDPRTMNWFFAEPGSRGFQVKTFIANSAPIVGAIAAIVILGVWLASRSRA